MAPGEKSRPRLFFYPLVGVAIWFGFVFGPTLKTAMGLSFNKYRSYRYAHPLKKRQPGVQIKLTLGPTPKAYRPRDRRLLFRSLLPPMSKASSCSTYVFKLKRAKAKVSLPPKLGAMKIRLKLNPFGRVIEAKITKSSVGKAHGKCLLWYLQGRKLYPPRGNRFTYLRLGLAYVKARPSVSFQGRIRSRRRRSGKW